MDKKDDTISLNTRLKLNLDTELRSLLLDLHGDIIKLATYDYSGLCLLRYLKISN